MEITQRIFVKRTRRGKVRRVVREHYLRDDILSGSPHIDEAHLEPRLSPDAKRYLVPDANVLLHQIDVLEHSALQDVILLQTVLSEVRHRRVALYNRARAVAADPQRRCVVFCNEHARESFVARETGESPNDYNDRAIRAAVDWYAHQLRGTVEVTLLTNDRDNLRKARAAGLSAFTIHEYVRSLTAHPDLADMLAGEDSAEHTDSGAIPVSKRARTASGGGAVQGGSGTGGTIYVPHLDADAIKRGLACGELHQGRLRINRHNAREGYVGVPSLGAGNDVRISGREALNRGVHGDMVVLRLLANAPDVNAKAMADDEAAQAELGAAGVYEYELGGDPDEMVAAANAVIKSAKPGAGKGGKAAKVAKDERIYGEVVAIAKRNWRACVGVLDYATQRGSNFVFEPVDILLPRASVTTRQPEALRNQLIVVQFDSWGPDQRYPSAHYVRTIGPVGDKDAESDAILFEHDVPTRPFSAQVRACLPPKGWQIPDDEIAKRLDLRETALVCSVDPPGCVDIDDALHVRTLSNGNFEVGIHIADVGHFIKAGTPIDEEAAIRATTVYLVQRRINMVPERLGEDLCSLFSKVDRLAFSALVELTTDGEIIGAKFAKTVICSKAALSYAQAQDRIDDKEDSSDLTEGLRTLNRLAKKLNLRRRDRGSLNLASPEVRFQLDGESAEPKDMGVYQLKETNAMVEEFMLLANTAVAREITTQFPQFAILRRHPPPRPGAFDTLNRALGQLSPPIALKTGSSRELADSLDAALDFAVPGEPPVKFDPYLNKLVRIMATRSMQQAEYFRAGALSLEEFWHYGLAAEIYTHFTSPIRRYSDQLVHRMLAAAIGIEPLSQEMLRPERLEALVDNMNRRHVAAQHAGRASVSVFTMFFFRERKEPVREEGYIIGLREKGAIVLVPRYGIEGLILGLIDENNPGAYVYDEEKCTLRTPFSLLRVFQKVTVEIVVDASKPHRPRLVIDIVQPQVRRRTCVMP